MPILAAAQGCSPSLFRYLAPVATRLWASKRKRRRKCVCSVVGRLGIKLLDKQVKTIYRSTRVWPRSFLVFLVCVLALRAHCQHGTSAAFVGQNSNLQGRIDVGAALFGNPGGYLFAGVSSCFGGTSTEKNLGQLAIRKLVRGNSLHGLQTQPIPNCFRKSNA